MNEKVECKSEITQNDNGSLEPKSDFTDIQQLWAYVHQLHEEIRKRDEYIHKQNSHIYDMQKELFPLHNIATNTIKPRINKPIIKPIVIKTYIGKDISSFSNPTILSADKTASSKSTEKAGNSSLESTTVEEMVDAFVSAFPSLNTQRNYFDGFRQLFEQGLLNEKMTLAEFRLVDSQALLRLVRESFKSRSSKTQEFVEANDATKRLRHGMLSGFFIFLNQQTKGRFGKWGKWEHWKKAPLRPKTIGSNLPPELMELFLTTLQKLSQKAYLFASIAFAAGVTMDQVSHLRIEHINFFKNEVLFKKKNGLYDMKGVIIPYSLLEELKCLIGIRKIGYVFLKNNTLEEDDIPIPKNEITRRYNRAWDAMILAFGE